LINILIVNYEKLNRQVSGRPHLFREVADKLKSTLQSFSRAYHKNAQLAVVDKAHAEFSVVVPAATSAVVNQLSRYLKNRYHRYFQNAGLGNYFVNIGLLPYSSKDSALVVKHIPASIHMKKIYMGMELRKASRVEYQADVQVSSPGKKTDLSKTIDISEHGLCYISAVAFKTDTKIKLTLMLDVQKDTVPLVLQSSVAWIKAIGASTRRGGRKYAVGLEFTRINAKARFTLSRFVRSQAA
jgi:hypothetical protein